MEYKDWKDIKKLALESEDKQYRFWGCAFYQRSGMDKILRNVKPQELVMVINPEYLELLKLMEEKGIDPNNYSTFENDKEKRNIKDQYDNYKYQFRKSAGYWIERIHAFNKQGQMLSKQVTLTGNTSSSDDALRCYDNEKECKDKYNELVYKALEQSKTEKIRTMDYFERNEKTLEDLFVDTDYLMEKLRRG